jgi:hypothetical protein
MLAACQPADFSRPAPAALYNTPQPVPRLVTAAGTVPLPLTDLEQALRTRAAALSVATSPLADALPPFTKDLALYGARLRSTAYASSGARFARLHDDIADDRLRFDAFEEVAANVAGRDAIRRKALDYIATGLAEDEALAARMADNAAVAVGTLAVLRQRAAAYRIALEHLVLATPSPDAVAAENALLRLEDDLGNAEP